MYENKRRKEYKRIKEEMTGRKAWIKECTTSPFLLFPLYSPPLFFFIYHLNSGPTSTS